jgi:hypothetical protein
MKNEKEIYQYFAGSGDTVQPEPGNSPAGHGCYHP